MIARIHLILISLLSLGGLTMNAQDCTTTSDNVLCAENPPVSDSLGLNPVSFDCFDAQLTYFFSFQTGSNVGASLNVAIFPGDCDSFIGPDDISIIIIELPVGADACDPANYTPATPCFSSPLQDTYTFTNLTPEGNFILLVGSNHDLTYGPCTFDLAISGSAVDLITTVTPFLIVLGESADLEVTGGDTGASYTWTPAETLDSSTSPTVTTTPEQSTTFTATSSIGECVVTSEVTITVGPPIYVYNSFTPNGDGFNDVWLIKGIERFEDALVTIYDRWGQTVFRSLGYGTPWDGTNRGKFLPMGAYYYVIELNSPEITIPPITGVVSIIK